MTAKKKPTKAEAKKQEAEIEKVKEKVDAQTPKASHVEVAEELKVELEIPQPAIPAAAIPAAAIPLLSAAIIEIRERIEHNELISGIQRKPWKVKL